MEMKQSLTALAALAGSVAYLWCSGIEPEGGFEDDDARWARFPLVVRCASFAGQGRGCDVAKAAVDAATEQLGEGFFEWRDGVGVGDINVEVRALEVWGDGEAERWPANFSLEEDDGVLTHCEIVVRRGTGREKALILHMLGHCLGLGHDRRDTSIMHDYVHELPLRKLPHSFSRYDRRLLRSAYFEED